MTRSARWAGPVRPRACAQSCASPVSVRVSARRPSSRERAQLGQEGELRRGARRVHERRSVLRAGPSSASRIIERIGAMPVPPATKSSGAASERSGSVKLPTGPSIRRRAPGSRLLHHGAEAARSVDLDEELERAVPGGFGRRGRDRVRRQLVAIAGGQRRRLPGAIRERTAVERDANHSRRRRGALIRQQTHVTRFYCGSDRQLGARRRRDAVHRARHGDRVLRVCLRLHGPRERHHALERADVQPQAADLRRRSASAILTWVVVVRSSAVRLVVAAQAESRRTSSRLRCPPDWRGPPEGGSYMPVAW